MTGTSVFRTPGQAVDSIPRAAPPFPVHLGACAQFVTSFRRKPEQLLPPPLLVLLPPFLASWPWALGSHLPFPPSLSLCYSASSPTMQLCRHSSNEFCVFLNTRVPNLLR